MPKLHLGTIGWSYNFWKGPFYSTKTTSKDFLAYYAKQFNTVEVDSTFYRMPIEQTVLNWAAQTPEGFLFSLKFPQVITHVKMLRNCQRETTVFLDRVGLLGDKLGCLLLQFPPNFAATHWQDLATYLQELPKGRRYVIEVRNKSWLNQDFYKLLRDNRVALAWSEAPLMMDINEVTTDFLYMRWEGDRKAVNGTLGKIELDRTADLQRWTGTLEPYLSRGMEVFGYFGKYFSGYPPSDIKTLSKLLNNTSNSS
jgi:uncharacterized protein YecE (DUF72 family)